MTATHLEWTPLLDGATAVRALESIQAIAAALRVPPPATSDSGDARAIEGASLAGGRAGFAILYSYLARATIVDGTGASDAFLDDAIAALSEVTLPPDLYMGFTGIGWVVSHLADADDDAPDLDEIDGALLTYLDRSPWTGQYDLIAGLVGIALYALERLPQPCACALLDRVIDRLDEAAEHDGRGARWLTAPELLPEWQRALCPRGYYNLGLAHGIPGVIAVLAAACAAGVGGAKARRLLSGAVAWLLSQRISADEGAAFPSWIGVGGEPRPARLAWCYGDPGVAAALLLAGRAAGESSWEHAAIAIARRAARCPMDRSGVRDAGLCHGAAGLAHIFNRFYQATGDDTFAAAARCWFARTLDLRQPGTGIAGYRTAEGEVDGVVRWIDDPGLLGGAPGIALALLAAVSHVEPAWDRMLLLSLPPLTLAAVS